MQPSSFGSPAFQPQPIFNVHIAQPTSPPPQVPTCCTLLGKCCADWSSPMAAALVLGGLPIFIYEFVQEEYFFGSVALVATVFSTFLFGRVACLKPQSDLGQNVNNLGLQVTQLAQERAGLMATVDEMKDEQTNLSRNLATAQADYTKLIADKERTIEALTKTNADLDSSLEKWKGEYVVLQKQCDQITTDVRSHVESSTKVTTALVNATAALQAFQPGMADAVKRLSSVREDEAKGLTAFEGENATMDKLLKQFKANIDSQEAVRNELESLQKSLQSLVDEEGLVGITQAKVEEGTKRLQEIEARMEALTPILAEKVSQLQALQKQINAHTDPLHGPDMV